MGYLRNHEIEEIENEKRVLENTLTSRSVQERGNLEAHIRRIDKELSEKAPPDLSSEDCDRLSKECRDIEGRLVPNMPSDMAMRRNPPGTVGAHMRYEKLAKSREHFPEGDLMHWKENQLALNKGSDDPDVANFERMRPGEYTGESMGGAQIPGQRFFNTNPSEQYKLGHDETFGKEDHQLKPNGDHEPEPKAAAPVKKKAGKKKGKMKRTPVAMLCGRMMSSQGRHSHQRSCPECLEVSEG